MVLLLWLHCRVLINIYFNGGGVVTPDSPSGVSIVDFNTAFKAGFNAAAADSTDDRVQQFYRRNALAINFQDGIINANFHPSLLSQNISAEIDPTLRAVLLGSYVGKELLTQAKLFTQMLQSFILHSSLPHPTPPRQHHYRNCYKYANGVCRESKPH